MSPLEISEFTKCHSLRQVALRIDVSQKYTIHGAQQNG